MKGGAVIEPFVHQLLESLHHQWGNVWVKLNYDFAEAFSVNHRHLRIRKRFYTFGDWRFGFVVGLQDFRLWSATCQEHSQQHRRHRETFEIGHLKGLPAVEED